MIRITIDISENDLPEVTRRLNENPGLDIVKAYFEVALERPLNIRIDKVQEIYPKT